MIGLEVAFLTVFWGWALTAILFLRNTILPRALLVATPESLGIPFESVKFYATDGIPLDGWILRAEPERPWLILCHGLGTNRSDLLMLAARLHTARFNLLLFDFRGHGTSGGRGTSFGWLEQRDLEGALAFLGAHAGVPARPYGVYGVSMGGAVAIMTAARDERIGAVAVESPYTNLQESLQRHMQLFYPMIPRQPFGWFMLATYRLRFGVWPDSVAPVHSAAALSPRPLLLIQAEQDVRMPLAEARRILDAAGEPKALWIVKGGGHLEAFGLQPEEYGQRLKTFFELALGS